MGIKLKLFSLYANNTTYLQYAQNNLAVVKLITAHVSPPPNDTHKIITASFVTTSLRPS